MRISEKVFMDMEGLIKHGPINIVAFGDSVTHGSLNGEIDYETVYWNVLKQKINKLRSYVPVNAINAGIGGINAKNSLARMEKQVLSHLPDLVIVCFGLNDVNGELDDYLSSLKIIFDKCTASGAEVIFMTPNMLNTYVAEDTPPEHLGYAKITAEYQNGGRMDLFISSAVELAKNMNIQVCDCYSKWKELSKTQDTTKLLINRINHPNREMHRFFADELYKIIFKDCRSTDVPTESTMYRE